MLKTPNKRFLFEQSIKLNALSSFYCELIFWLFCILYIWDELTKAMEEYDWGEMFLGWNDQLLCYNTRAIADTAT